MARKQDEEKRKNIIESAIGIFGEKGFYPNPLSRISAMTPVCLRGRCIPISRTRKSSSAVRWMRAGTSFSAEWSGSGTTICPSRRKILWLIDFGFDVIKELHPLLRGMYSDAARRSLIRTRLDDIIDMLRDITFDGDSSRVFGMYRDEKIRDFLLRSIVQGVFFDLSTTTAEDLDEETNRLRQLLKQGLETMTL